MSELVSTAYEVDGVKKYYGGTITVAGRNLITSLLAGETIEFTRIMVGSGALPEGVEPIDMTDLVNPIAEATSTIPIVEDGEMFMVVEYRNDMNGGLKTGFWLSEFGIYAKTEKSEEVLLYYATLGDSPQPVSPYRDNRIDIRRYPVTVALELDADVQVTYNPGAFVTSAEAKQLVDAMVREAMAGVGKEIIVEITIPAAGWAYKEDMPDFEDEYRYYVDVPLLSASAKQFPSVALHKQSFDIAREARMCPTVQSQNGSLRFWAQQQPFGDIEATVALYNAGSAVIRDITIPAKDWTMQMDEGSDGQGIIDDEYRFSVDVAVSGAEEGRFPNVALYKEALKIARLAGLCPTVQSLPGFLRFWARNEPTEDMGATVAFLYMEPGGEDEGGDSYALPVATATQLGGVKVQKGSGLTVDSSGNIAIDGATGDEVRELCADPSGKQK